MKTEFHRQLVHISGIVFIILAQLVGRIVSAWLFIIAVTLFLYSSMIVREYRRMDLLSKLEGRLRHAVISLERQDIPRPFTGAVWFFLSFGLAFLVFPLPIASAACTALAVGDSLSTLAGSRLGRHRLLGKKTLEGSLACFIGSLASFIFVGPIPATLVAVTATVAELLPETSALKGLKKRGLIDDNFLIPILSGLILLLVLV